MRPCAIAANTGPSSCAMLQGMSAVAGMLSKTSIMCAVCGESLVAVVLEEDAILESKGGGFSSPARSFYFIGELSQQCEMTIW